MIISKDNEFGKLREILDQFKRIDQHLTFAQLVTITYIEYIYIDRYI